MSSSQIFAIFSNLLWLCAIYFFNGVHLDEKLFRLRKLADMAKCTFACAFFFLVSYLNKLIIFLFRMRVNLGLSRPNEEMHVLLWMLSGHLPEPLRVYIHRTLVDTKKLNPGMTVGPPPGFIGSARASSILQHMRAAHSAYIEDWSSIGGDVGEEGGEPVVLLPDETPLLAQ